VAQWILNTRENKAGNWLEDVPERFWITQYFARNGAIIGIVNPADSFTADIEKGGMNFTSNLRKDNAQCQLFNGTKVLASMWLRLISSIRGSWK
jgi:hypothetical protein